MSEFTQLENSTPIIIPPKDAVVYDKLWIDLLTFQFPSPISEGSLYARLVPCRDINENGDKELKPFLVDGDVKVVTTDEIYKYMGSDPEVAMAFELVLRSVRKIGIEKGIMKNNESQVLSSYSETSSSSSSSYDDSSVSSQSLDVPIENP